MSEKVGSRSVEKYNLMVNFLCDELNLTKPELNFLSKRIKEVKGHIRVIMHPYALGVEFNTFVSRTLGQHMATVSRPESSGVIAPTFIFVEDYLLTMYKETLEKVAGVDLTKLGIILIPTFLDQGRPSDDFLKIGDEFEKKYYGKTLKFNGPIRKKEEQDMIKSFYFLINVFRIIGVKSVTASGGFIGGMPLHEAEMDRCLGSLVEFLRKGDIKVDISKHVKYKDGLSRDVLRDTGVPLKETNK